MDLQTIQHDMFYMETDVIYPPFKQGYYMEEYFFHYMKKHGLQYDKQGRRYIPALWTNFQIDPKFHENKESMQTALDNYIADYPCEKGYFIVIQHDDGPMLRLPTNTTIYGACTGSLPLPLIYEDQSQRLATLKTNNMRPFGERTKLCSFVGTITHKVRQDCINEYQKYGRYSFHTQPTWSNVVSEDLQDIFIKETMNAKFALAPRGYGRSSFRFFEILQLGTIPIYVWDDKEWLPYKDKIEYDKFCISIHESEIDILDEILSGINEKVYNKMLAEYEKIKPMFELEYMCEYITNNNPVPV